MFVRSSGLGSDPSRQKRGRKGDKYIILCAHAALPREPGRAPAAAVKHEDFGFVLAGVERNGWGGDVVGWTAVGLVSVGNAGIAGLRGRPTRHGGQRDRDEQEEGREGVLGRECHVSFPGVAVASRSDPTERVGSTAWVDRIVICPSLTAVFTNGDRPIRYLIASASNPFEVKGPAITKDFTPERVGD